MQKLLLLFLLVLLANYVPAQPVQTRLASAYKSFENDPQLKHAIASLYVVDAKSGKVIFDRNSKLGLATASTMKVITSVTAYEVLGNNYQYKTSFAISKDGQQLYIRPSGDPTLGSWRWESTKEEQVINRILSALGKQDASRLSGIIINNQGWEGESIPDGWTWQDIGNYYGAGAASLNWRENQFDLVLRSGNEVGDKVDILHTIPFLYGYEFVSYLEAGPKGSGDNAYIYYQPTTATGVVRGTIPVNERRFVISGSIPSPSHQFIATVLDSLIPGAGDNRLSRVKFEERSVPGADGYQIFHVESSPPLDSVIYWFNRRSINLYGEALVKTMAFEKSGKGNTAEGVKLLQEFWKEKGISSAELNVYDGSGLSPSNRVTTRAQVEVLKFARGRKWFPSFYHSLPEFNKMKMKSGTISDVKGFTGYHKSSGGNEYIFSFLVNNYSGSASSLVQKMYRVLDELK